MKNTKTKRANLAMIHAKKDNVGALKRANQKSANQKSANPKNNMGESSKSSNLSLKTLQVKELLTSMESKREFAKLGMSASLLICVGSAVFRGDFARKLHIASGVALVGFSIWHHSLYK